MQIRPKTVGVALAEIGVNAANGEMLCDCFRDPFAHVPFGLSCKTIAASGAEISGGTTRTRPLGFEVEAGVVVSVGFGARHGLDAGSVVNYATAASHFRFRWSRGARLKGFLAVFSGMAAPEDRVSAVLAAHQR